MAYQYENVKLEKGMYGQNGRSFLKVLEIARPERELQGHGARGAGRLSAPAQAL
ncbi:MAG: hypothetical protein ACLRSD_07410 [Oscillibacter sp.]